MRVVVMDTETTGTHDNAEIAQLAAILFDEQRRPIAQFKSLVKPDGWSMSDETAKWHKDQGSTVSMENCERFGLGINTVLGLFTRYCERADVLVCHNSKYDVGRVQFAAKKRGIVLALPHKIDCTQELAAPIMKMEPTARMKEYRPDIPYKSPKLSEACEFFLKRKHENAHDAFADVIAAAEIYFAILDWKEPNAKG